MKKTYEILLFAILTLFIFTCCEKLDLPKETPDCIKSKIEQIKNEPVRNPPSEVWRYDYKGQIVYYFPPYCCDMFSDLYDDKCNLLCHPDGGITGGGDGKCPDFFTTATNGKQIWKDNRGK